MTESLYCSMIHGGLQINLSNGTSNQCCLRKDRHDINLDDPWNNDRFEILRSTNRANVWDAGCSNCEVLEKSGHISFRQGMNAGLGIHGQTELAGPARLDLKFDVGCNLACRTCGPHNSTFWQHHLKEIGNWPLPISVTQNKDKMIDLLGKLDLHNLRQVVFCGGETLLGQQYWEVARWLVDHVPNAQENLTLCFQTNGTQSIDHKHYDIIRRCHLVKLHVSIDGVGAQFEYLRWPASWEQVQQNLMDLRENLPHNVLFLIEQTISILNVLDIGQVDQWVEKDFPANREGDPVTCTKHMANGTFGLFNASKELVSKIQETAQKSLIAKWRGETASTIDFMISEIKRFDQHRNQSFLETFPQVAQCYSRFW